ncbi:MAG: hypothetical protein RL077_2287 [Verrucomicrobiota bacterium]|jgi:O-antigen/teichoic acid export membrane protein
MTLLRKIRTVFSLDAAIVFNLLGTARSLIGGPLLALLIAAHFTPEVQGYYFTFASILGLQVLADLGLGTVLVQFAAHEWAGLAREVDGRISGHAENRSRLASLTRFAMQWYGGGALVAMVLLLVAGTLFLTTRSSEAIAWRWPWCFLAVMASTRLALTPLLSLLEGCKQIASVQAYRLWEGTQTIVVSGVAVLLGAGLWTLGIASAFSVISCLGFVVLRHGKFYRGLLAWPVDVRISWKHELLPMQWRIALSSISGYFVFQLFTPVMFRYQGAVEAGRMGMTLYLVSAVGSLAGAWINTRVPIFGALVAQRKWGELDSLALRSGVATVSAALLAAIGALLGIHILELYFPELASRFLGIGTSMYFLGAVVLGQVTFIESVYLRAFRREPFLRISLVTAVLTGLSTWQLGRTFGSHAVAMGYFSIIFFVALPVCTWILIRSRRDWCGSGTPARQSPDAVS